jgi:hypothetical protein
MKKKSAIFTLQHNEEFFLPMWIKYYSQHFAPEDMYIVCHNCSGKVLETIKDAETMGISIVPIKTDTIFDHDMLTNQVHTSQRNLLAGYEYVVFTDCDEFIVPTDCTLREFIDKADQPAYRCTGWDVVEDKMFGSPGFFKTLITKIPLTYCDGYHYSTPTFRERADLELYHLHALSYEELWQKNLRTEKESWDPAAITKQLSWHNRVIDKAQFTQIYYSNKEQFVEHSPNLTKLLEQIYEPEVVHKELGEYDILPMKGKDFYRTLKEGLQVLKDAKYPHWISAGTLLGLHRDGDYIPSDTDIDIGVRGNINRMIMPKDFTLVRTVDYGYRQMQQVYMHEPTQILFDIFNLHPFDDENYITIRDNGDGMFTKKALVDTLSEIKWKDLTIPVPNDLDTYLTAWYGDWRKPAEGGKRVWKKLS